MPAEMDSPLQHELTVAREAARRAARLCLAVVAEGFGRMEKSEREPVTVADFGSQAVILDAIATAFPGDAVIAEEGSADLVAAGPDLTDRVVAEVSRAFGETRDEAAVLAAIDHRGTPGRRTWAVDPIDGTKGFLRGDQFAIAIGLLVDGVPAAGVLACPRFELSGMPGVLVWGGPGIGAFVESLAGGGKARPLTVSGVTDPARARLLGSVETAHGDPELLQHVMEAVGIGGGWVRIDSQAKYAAVAAGMAEIYVRPRNRVDWRERVWDHASGAAIVAAAGARITDLDGKALDFTAGPTLEHNRGVLVTNGAIHDVVLAALAGRG